MNTYAVRMAEAELDPRDNPEYLTLSAASKECGVRVQVLQELVSSRALVDGVVRSRRGHAYLHRDSVPSWTQVEQLVSALYTAQLDRVDRTMRIVETEVEALRLDLTEAQENPDAPLGDDLRGASIYAYDRQTSKTLYGALTKLQTDVIELEGLKRHLDDIRHVV